MTNLKIAEKIFFDEKSKIHIFKKLLKVSDIKMEQHKISDLMVWPKKPPPPCDHATTQVTAVIKSFRKNENYREVTIKTKKSDLIAQRFVYP